MAISPTLEEHLQQQSADYDLVAHPHTETSMNTAAAAHVPGRRLAKAVIVKDGEAYLMVVVPSDHHVHLGRLHQQLGREVGLASEDELARLFPDCELGAIPPIGDLYGLKTLVDAGLFSQPEVFLESGDHAHLVKVSGAQFESLLAAAERVELEREV
jgi:Ala-tRNA(Pro) deacylase